MNSNSNGNNGNGNNSNTSRFERFTENLNKSGNPHTTPRARADYKENKKGSYVLRVGSVTKGFLTAKMRDDAYAVLSNGRFDSASKLIETLRALPSGFATQNTQKESNNNGFERTTENETFSPAARVVGIDEAYG